MTKDLDDTKLEFDNSSQQSFSQKMRRVLDAPFLRRPIWYLFLSPIFIFVSFCWAFCAFVRRNKGYSAKAIPQHVKVVCVGNVVVGGVGKSPFVRSLAATALSQGKCVAIIARGVGKKDNKQIICEFRQSSNEFNPREFFSKIECLADELREHALLLLPQLNANEGARLFLIQDSNRYNAVLAFSKLCDENSQAVCFLDDGLQHFKCPRHLNLCVWDPNLLGSAPPFSMPLGPYRESFGKNWGPFKMSVSLESCDIRVWSRTSAHGVGDFKESIRNILKSFCLVPHSETELILLQKMELRSVSLDSGFLKIQNRVDNFENFGVCNFIAGVAQPEKVLRELKNQIPYFESCKFNVIALDDHGNLSANVVQEIQMQYPCILTVKDFARWHSESIFVQLAEQGLLFVCLLEIEVQAWNEDHSNQRKEFIIDNKFAL